MQELNYNNYSFDGHPIRITLHWTGGSYVPSSLDAEHYQFLIGNNDGVATTYLGKYSVADQDSTAKDYAAHTKNFNTKNIGIALCGMHDAKEKKTFGKYPITPQQIDEMIRLCAYLCGGYGITPDHEHLASHCEISGIHGVPQSGQWDVSALSFSEKTWTALNDSFRHQVLERMNMLGAQTIDEDDAEDDADESHSDKLQAAIDSLVVAAKALEHYATVARDALK